MTRFNFTSVLSNAKYVTAPKKLDDGGVNVFQNATDVSTMNIDRTKSFVVAYDGSFFSENPNGDVADCGIVIAEGEQTKCQRATAFLKYASGP
jgi:hypothetical protein